jgi:sulfite reductase (NADPH) flavoprotein alpha-component
LQAGDAVSLYIHANSLFNVPEPSQDAIMIGAGTGVAPYRGFVYERAEQGHTGRNWLVFGNPHQHCDFLYQAEWQEHLATDALHKISLAFSRDSARKIYVQHRLREEAEAVRDWVANGAVVYVCGAKAPMAVDVEATLTEILGAATLATMAEQGRYVKDVY